MDRQNCPPSVARVSEAAARLHLHSPKQPPSLCCSPRSAPETRLSPPSLRPRPQGREGPSILPRRRLPPRPPHITEPTEHPALLHGPGKPCENVVCLDRLPCLSAKGLSPSHGPTTIVRTHVPGVLKGITDTCPILVSAGKPEMKECVFLSERRASPSQASVSRRSEALPRCRVPETAGRNSTEAMRHLSGPPHSGARPHACSQPGLNSISWWLLMTSSTPLHPLALSLSPRHTGAATSKRQGPRRGKLVWKRPEAQPGLGKDPGDGGRTQVSLGSGGRDVAMSSAHRKAGGRGSGRSVHPDTASALLAESPGASEETTVSMTQNKHCQRSKGTVV